jgi:ribosome-associated translation inhibitor RaiA
MLYQALVLMAFFGGSSIDKCGNPPLYCQMQILVKADNNVEGREKLAIYITGEVEHALGRFRERVTRVDVHLSDEKGDKGGQDDKRCVMEAHVTGHQPTVVTHHAPTLGQAVDGAVQKMKRSLDSTLDQQRDQRQHSD